MRRFQRTAFATGAVVTLLVLAADLAGLTRWLEDWTVDLRLKHARWVEEPPVDQIRLVGIDDPSLDSIGRWPWPRARLAGAVEEVARAGAKVSVFDVLFLEPEQGTDGDRRLAEAMRSHGMKSVVALSVLEEKLLGAVWETPGGRETLRRFTKACRGGIQRGIGEILDEAGIAEPWRSRIVDRPNSFKGLAAWMVLEEEIRAGRTPADLEAFVRLMLGGDGQAANIGEFAERVLLERAWRRGESWRRIAPKLRADPDTRGSPQDLPPVPELAEAGVLFGVVNAEPDRFDGRLRRITPMFATDYGRAPQLGIAAALAYMDRVPSDLDLGDGVLSIEGRAWPLRGGKLPLDWPTRLLNGYGDSQQEPLAVVRIGRLVELAEKRQALERQRTRWKELGHDLVFSGDQLPNSLRTDFDSKMADGRLGREIRTAMDDYEEALQEPPPPEITPEQRRIAGGLREWIRLDESVRATEAAVHSDEAELRRLLEGKLVFFGFIATGTMADMVSTIFDPRTPGVFGHVAVANMLLGGAHLRFVPAWISPAAVLALGLVAAIVAARFGAAAGFAALLLLLAGYAGLLGVVFFDRFDVVYPMAAPVLAGASSWIMATAVVAVNNQREKQRIQRQFRARVSPQLVDMLQENPRALSVQGEERETTILFGDLAGFTTISEKLGGPEVVKTLNLYMGAMTRELTEEHAYVNKFLGDGLLAFWSAFAPEPRQCEYAVKAAIRCQQLVKEIGQRPDRAGLPPISLRLGIATGKVVIGDCGAPPDLNDYTVIGDSVNLAGRLESANKQFGTSILVDGRTAGAARDAGLPLLRLGRVVVVGQSVPVDLFEVCLDADPGERVRLTEAGVDRFAAGDFDGARSAFDALEARFGRSKTAAAFREAIDRPGEMRDGVLRLKAK